MIRFRLPRVSVSIHWLFFVLIAFLGGATSVKSAAQLGPVLLFMLAAFCSILVHELGHAYTGIAFGARSSDVDMHMMGGQAAFPGHGFTRVQHIVVSLMGPGASLALAGVALVVLVVAAASTPLPEQVKTFVKLTVAINVFWSVFNLLPILPLDGGNVVRYTLGPGRLRTTCIISFVALAAAGVALWFLTQSFYNLLLVLLLASHTYQVYRQA